MTVFILATVKINISLGCAFAFFSCLYLIYQLESKFPDSMWFTFFCTTIYNK